MPYGLNHAKRASNIAKHGVDFAAVESFGWSSALVRADVRTDYGEVRLVALGEIRGRLHSLTYTIRRNATWIISLRLASKRENAAYENEA